MKKILSMIEEAKEVVENVEFVIIVGITCDVYRLTTSDLEGWEAPKMMMDINHEISEGVNYPAEKGVAEEIKRVENEIKKKWKEAKVLWVLPYPLDCKRYVLSRSVEIEENMPEEVRSSLDLVSFRGVRHLRIMEPLVRETGEQRLRVSWFPYWKSLGDRDRSFKSFMDSVSRRDGGRNLCPEATLDGLHPTKEMVEPLIRVLREAVSRESGRRKHKVSPVGLVSGSCSRELCEVRGGKTIKQEKETEEKFKSRTLKLKPSEVKEPTGGLLKVRFQFIIPSFIFFFKWFFNYLNGNL